jgi:hypothetical protein
MSSLRLSSAATLLRALLNSGACSPDQLASELAVSRATLARFLEGTQAIPLSRQLCLALFVIDRSPQHARKGHRLLGQVRAAIAYEKHLTTTHLLHPTARW